MNRRWQTSPRSQSGAISAVLLSSDYFLYLAPSVVQAAVSMLMVPFTTHYLQPADFGVFAIITAITMPVKAFVASGARWVIGGNYFKAPEQERRAMLFNVIAFELLLRAVLVVAFFFAAESILRWLVTGYHPQYVGYLNLVLASALAGSLWPSVSFLMTVRNQAPAFATIAVVQSVANAVTVLICLGGLDLGVQSLFLATLASSCTSLVFEVLYLRKAIDFRLDRRWLKEVVRTGLRAAPGGLAELTSNMADKIFIQRWAGLHMLGLYSHSQQYQSVFKMLTAALSNTLNSHSLKIFSRDLDPQPLQRMLSAWYGALAVMGVGVVLFTDEVIALLTHGKFVRSAPLVLIWYLMVFSVSHAIPYSTFLIARKHNRVLMHTQTAPTLCGIGLVMLATYRYGVFGAAWALVATSVAIQIMRSWAAHRLGYKGIAEGRFTLAVTVYLLLWIADNFFSWSLKTELCIAAVLIPALAVHFRLIPELMRAFVTREGERGVE